jgi:hypothetical protein
MSDERVSVTFRDLSRWLIVALLLAGGLAAYFMLAADSDPVMPPAMVEVDS